MEGNKYRNMIKTIIIFLVELVIVAVGLNVVSFYTGAGDTNYWMSLIFVAAQAAVFITVYICWYNTTDKEAIEMFNLDKMRKMAYHRIPSYWLVAFFVSAGLGAAGIVAMAFGLLFDEISLSYGLASMITEFALGNITLLLMMRIWGLPDRILGRI